MNARRGRLPDSRWLTDLLAEWARYMESLEGLGFADSNILWRAQFGQDGTFGPRLPVGLAKLDVAGELKACAQAIDRLKNHSESEIRLPIRTMMLFYLFGRHRAAEIMEIGLGSVAKEVQSGERLLRLELRR